MSFGIYYVSKILTHMLQYIQVQHLQSMGYKGLLVIHTFYIVRNITDVWAFTFCKPKTRSCMRVIKHFILAGTTLRSNRINDKATG